MLEIWHYYIWLIKSRNNQILFILQQFLKLMNIIHRIFYFDFSLVYFLIFFLEIVSILLFEFLNALFMIFNDLLILPLNKFQSLYFLHLMAIFDFSIKFTQFMLKTFQMPFLFLLNGVKIHLEILNLRNERFIDETKILKIYSFLINLYFFKLFKRFRNLLLLLGLNAKLCGSRLDLFRMRNSFNNNRMMKESGQFFFIHIYCSQLQLMKLNWLIN